uniref:TMEM248/TMEM219 domain-containing protein n=1 Tax=Oryctolagus cuniculus TaxID=9986 RepID=A0A5F9CNE4_RABIT
MQCSEHPKQCREMNFGGQEPWSLVRALPLAACAALALALVASGFGFPLHKVGKCLVPCRLLSSSRSLSSRRLSLEAQTPLLPMGSCQAGHNLHLCLVHHPPLVCATLILLLLGLSGLGLGGFLLTHRSGLRSPDIPEVSAALLVPGPRACSRRSSRLPTSFCTQDWVSFLRSFGQLTLCPVDGTVTATRQGAHVVGLVTTLNFGDGADRNKTQTFQASIPGRQLGLKGSSAEEPILVTARVTPERTPGACLYFNAAPGILPSSQPPISCLEDGAGNATLSPRMGGAGSVWLQAADLGLLPASLLWPSLLCHCCVLPPTPGVALVQNPAVRALAYFLPCSQP